MKVSLKGLLSNGAMKNSLILSLANIAALGCGFIVSLILPKILGAYQYGVFTLVITVLSLISVVFEFGVFVSIGRILTTASSAAERDNILSIAMRFIGIVAIAFAICSYVTSLFIDYFFPDKIGFYLANVAVFSIAVTLPFALGEIWKASGNYGRLAVYAFFSKALYAGVILWGYYFNCLSVKFCLTAVLSAPIITLIAVSFRWIMTIPKDCKDIILEIYEVNRDFGIKNYLGRLISTPIGYLSTLFLGYFAGVVDIGVFSLSVALASPLQLIADSLTAVKFRECVFFRAISKSYIRLYTVISCTGGIVVFLIGAALFRYYYKGVYLERIDLLAIVVFSQVVCSLYTIYNQWLAANAQGRVMLYTGSIYAFLQLSLGFALTYFYGVYGLALAFLIARGYFLLHTMRLYFQLKIEG